MREAALAGVSRRKGPRTTRRDPQARPAPDLVERRFVAEAPDRLWVADITYVPTAVGFLYLAVVLDVFSRWVPASAPTVPRTPRPPVARYDELGLAHLAFGRHS